MKTELNQPLRRNALTGSVSNFESPARRGWPWSIGIQR